MSLDKTCFQKLRETQLNCAHIDILCTKWDFWDASTLRSCLQKPSYQVYFYQRPNMHWEALVLIQQGPYSSDLIYLYVLEESRGMGIGTGLLDFLWEDLKEIKSHEFLYLEVRPSNTVAINVYRKFGMKVVGERKKYYKNGENAFVLRRDIHEENSRS